jgi:hypothetical protein
MRGLIQKGGATANEEKPKLTDSLIDMNIMLHEQELSKIIAKMKE